MSLLEMLSPVEMVVAGQTTSKFFYSFSPGKILDPPVDVAKLGAHGSSKTSLTKVGDVPDVRTAF